MGRAHAAHPEAPLGLKEEAFFEGARRKAQQAIEDLHALGAKRYTSAFALAIIDAGLNDRDQALEHLEAAFEERSDTMAILGVYPVLDGLRTDARFRGLVERTVVR